ncbi:hypothetical protein TDMWS_13270 [Thermodesulfomicrobium sp. WS]|nr:hypothetical protein TDMWS_13270 [Thermodesulfomicrobium sp. WS]
MRACHALFLEYPANTFGAELKTVPGSEKFFHMLTARPFKVTSRLLGNELSDFLGNSPIRHFAPSFVDKAHGSLLTIPIFPSNHLPAAGAEDFSRLLNRERSGHCLQGHQRSPRFLCLHEYATPVFIG